jgi:hypothetical protein
LVLGHPGGVGRIPLFHRLVLGEDGDLFLSRLLDATYKIFKLCGSDCRQHLSTPKGIMCSDQLLSDRDGKDGGDHGRSGGGGGRHGG